MKCRNKGRVRLHTGGSENKVKRGLNQDGFSTGILECDFDNTCAEIHRNLCKRFLTGSDTHWPSICIQIMTIEAICNL